MSNEVVSVTKDAYKWVRCLSTMSSWLLWLSASILVADVAHVRYNLWMNSGLGLWEYARNGQVLLILAYHLTISVVAVLHFNASKRKYPDLVDNVYGTQLSYPQSKNYFSSQKCNTPEKKLAWNIAENVFYSWWIMMKGINSMVLKIVAIFFVFITSFFLDHSQLFIAILKLTIPFVWLKKAVVYFYACYQLNRLNCELRDLLVNKRIANEMKAQSLKYALTYESLMAWLNTPVSEKIYKKYRIEINKNFEDYSSHFVI